MNRRTQAANFKVWAKKRLLDLGWSQKTLAKRLGLHRNTVTLAINVEGLFQPTKDRIRKELAA